jgi:hypothetical protein
MEPIGYRLSVGPAVHHFGKHENHFEKSLRNHFDDLVQVVDPPSLRAPILYLRRFWRYTMRHFGDLLQVVVPPPSLGAPFLFLRRFWRCTVRDEVDEDLIL